MDREVLVVMNVDGGDALIGFAVGDGGFRVLADFPAEHHVGAGHGHAVAPGGAGLDGEIKGDALTAVGQGLDPGEAVLDGRQFDAQQAGQLPIVAVDHQGPARHGQHVAFGQHGVDDRAEGGRELGHADDQLVTARPRVAGGEQQGGSYHGQDQPFHVPVSAAVLDAIVAIRRSKLERA